MNGKTLSGWSNRRQFSNRHVIDHLKSEKYLNELDDLKVTHQLTINDKLVRNNGYKLLTQFEDDNIDYSTFNGRLLQYTNTPCLFNDDNEPVLNYKDATVDQGLSKVKLCDGEYSDSIAGILYAQLVTDDTNNITYFLGNFRNIGFNSNHKLCQYIPKGHGQVYVIQENTNELDLTPELLQGTYNTYVNGVLGESVVIDCLDDGSLVITQPSTENTMNSLQTQITTLQNIINELTMNN